MQGSVAVVGSLNLDLVIRVAELPGPGETVRGGDLFRYPGGKGANQAVAAAGVDGSRVRVVEGVPSGTACVTVSEDGENQIVVSAGATPASPPTTSPPRRPCGRPR